MTRQLLLILIVLTVALSGCHPTQPFYMRESGELATYLDHETEISEPDYEQYRLVEVEQSMRPLLLSNPKHGKEWNITLEECIAIAMHNSKVIRGLAQVRQPANIGGLNSGSGLSFSNRTASATTIYDAAIQDTDPNSGMHAALSNFDAQYTTNVFWQKNERPQNVVSGTLDSPDVVLQDQAQVDMSIVKPTAPGTQFRLGSQTVYDQNNRGFGRAQPSDWTQAFEFEITHPLFRNRGTQVNRVPIVLARLNTDISLASFQAEIRNLAFDIEKTYWDLHTQYRELETAKTARNAAQQTWKLANALSETKQSIQDSAQAEEQYYFFKSRVQAAWRELLNTENNLRWLMGLSPTDNRVLRPIEEPTQAQIKFEWREVLMEMLVRRAELRQQKWFIKRRELELIAARNQLLPQLNVVALYRWLGVGDDLSSANRRGLNFPARGSLAFDELTEGRYAEWRIGLDFTPPRIGARRELATVRNAELNLMRDKERLREMELNITHALTQVLRNMDSHYNLAQSHFNRWRAAEKEAESVMALFPEKLTIDRVLDAQRRRADAQIEFFREISEYSKAIAEVHYRKGSLLDTHNIQLAEGPWPKKAYFDALGRARKRDASQYLNYGWTRPNVVSRGAHAGDQSIIDSSASESGEMAPPQQPTPAGGGEPLPRPQPQRPEPRDDNAATAQWQKMGISVPPRR